MVHTVPGEQNFVVLFFIGVSFDEDMQGFEKPMLMNEWDSKSRTPPKLVDAVVLSDSDISNSRIHL